MSEIRTDTINNASGDNDSGIDLSTNDVVAVKIAGNEKARVDSSGNLLVGTTTSSGFQTSSSATGTIAYTGGAIASNVSGDAPLYLNRLTSDGDIAVFRKNGTAVGSIGVANTDQLTIGTSDGSEMGLRFDGDLEHILPTDASGAKKDDLADLGSTTARFDNIYATNNIIQTSDQNEKNTITDSDLGIDFIKRLTPKSYIFNGKTRTHYGLIAQDVETILTDINKPTSGFAGFIKDDISEEQDGSEYRYGLRYGEFIAPLIQAVKDQQAIIENLQARITALENA